MTEIVEITTDFIRLDSFLKLAGFFETGGQAKLAVKEERVKVNGEVCPMRGKKLHSGDLVEYGGRSARVEKAG